MNSLASSLAAAMVVPAFCLAPQAAAQSNVPQLTPVQVEGESSPYDVQVSSQTKFTAPLVDTPKSVQVIPQAVIQDTAATSLQDVLRNSPGITFGAGEGGQPLADRPFIRGNSSANNIFVDGIRDPGGQTREIFNLESVEVIKGADSAIGGQGSGGGSINMVTKQARLGNFAEGTFSVGTDSYLRGTADGNWQFTDDAAFRLNVMGTKGNVPGRNVVDFNRWGIAPSLAFGLGTPTRVTLSYYHLQTDDMSDYGVPLARKIGATTSDGLLGIGRDKFYGLLDRDYRKTKADIGTLRIEHDFNDHITFRNSTRYGQTLNDYVVTNPGDGGNAVLDPVTNEWWMKRGTKSRWNQTTMLSNVSELYGEFKTGSIGHSYNVGIELTKERNKNASYDVNTTDGSFCPAVIGGVDCTLLYHPDPHDRWNGTIERGDVAEATTTTKAIYLFDTIKFSEQWLANVGLRYDNYHLSADYLANRRSGAPAGSNNESWDMFNYQLGLVYKPAPNGSIYLSYATASTPPTVSGGDQTAGGDGVDQLDPEKSSTIELGTKWNVLDEKLALTAALFQNERKDARIETEPGVFTQAGKTRVKGLELGFAGSITPKWQVFGGYTYMKSKLVKGNYGSVAEGEELANTPKHSFSLWTTYKVLPELTVGGGAYYVGKTYGGNQGGQNTNGVYMPSYWRFDAMAAYEVNDHLTMQLNVLNLTDKDYYTSTNGTHYVLYGPGRQAILSANVRF